MAAGDVSDALAAQLAVRLEDEANQEFSNTTKLKMLDRAQLQLCNMLHNAYLSEFEAIKSSADASGGSVTFATIDSGGILRGAEGILKVKVAPGGSNAVWALEIDLKNIKITENTYQAYDDERIMYYVWDEQVYILCTTSVGTTADIYYLEKPAEITTNFDPLLNTSLHNLLLDLAEAKCWAINGQFDRRKEIMDYVLTQIETLNARHAKPEGIGTKSYKGK